MPFETAGFAINTNIQRVFFADGNLGGVKDALSAAFKTEEHVPVIVELAALNECRQIGGEFFDLQARHIFGEIFGVCADITHTTRGT